MLILASSDPLQEGREKGGKGRQGDEDSERKR